MSQKSKTDNNFTEEIITEYIDALKTLPFETQAQIDECFAKFNVSTSELTPVDVTPLPLEVPFSLRATSVKTDTKKGSKKMPTRTRQIEAMDSDEETDFEHHQDLILENIDLSTPGRTLLRDTSFTLVKNKVYGLVGQNGIGKSTLLRGIKRREFGLPRVKICLVKQEHFYTPLSVIEYLIPGNIEGTSEDNNANLGEAIKILNGFGFTDIHAKIDSLSGGFKCKVRLAKAILSCPHLLLLDEPTNMLDIPSISHLVACIKNMHATVLVVSHDTFFLDLVSDSILLLENLTVKTYTGNFSVFSQLRLEEHARLLAAHKKATRDRAHLQEFIDRFRCSASKASLVQSKIKVMEKIEVPEVLELREFKFAIESSVGKPLVLEMIGVDVSIGDTNQDSPKVSGEDGKRGADGVSTGRLLLKNICLKVQRTDRIAIVGMNGNGKSSLLKALAGTSPYQGTILLNGVAGYFAQHHSENLPQGGLVQDVVKDRGLLAKYGLAYDTSIDALSGGQKSRLVLARISMQKPALLLLDEPTNHLDVECIDALVEAINAYGGGVVCVSHDVNFLRKCFKECYVCERQGLWRVDGGVEEYVRLEFKLK